MSRRKPRARAPRKLPDPSTCMCGLAVPYDACCGRLHRGQSTAATPEQLMRSRFSAFAVQDEAYLLRSWHPTTRPPGIDFDPALRWRRLEILDSSGGSAFHTEGTVEFRAHWTRRGQPGALHENSRFLRAGAAWLYLEGNVSG
ncbi:YchJ family metal-binding protein [Streptomyces sp. ACA25]|uniref:YchJ family protein n=1 Tax=Streptomyces sp. ACA25 TaxID=3022596 RepID=UPI00230805E8|nr:YchJ family metal-binding protein [Streptomyces sp. ACA25]MDB1090052.1 YchJ family metal-binding protein [Streptomyces sp. ACA25]